MEIFQYAFVENLLSNSIIIHLPQKFMLHFYFTILCPETFRVIFYSKDLFKKVHLDKIKRKTKVKKGKISINIFLQKRKFVPFTIAHFWEQKIRCARVASIVQPTLTTKLNNWPRHRWVCDAVGKHSRRRRAWIDDQRIDRFNQKHLYALRNFNRFAIFWEHLFLSW